MASGRPKKIMKWFSMVLIGILCTFVSAFLFIIGWTFIDYSVMGVLIAWATGLWVVVMAAKDLSKVYHNVE